MALEVGGALSAEIPVGWRLRAIMAAALIPPMLELLPLTRLERVLTFTARAQMSSVPDDLVAARWVDDTLAGMPRPWTRTCLRRAVVLYHLMRAAGRAVDLCIGVRRDERGEMLAHAWLLRDGDLYLEPDSTSGLVSRYSVIARFPQRP
ncbi:MAG: lasso peptide biosynthesis B2 protein [bacterium]